jgi:hypothetical protein
MVVNIVLGIRVSPNSFQRVTVRNISLDSKVEQLKLEASKTVNLSRHFLGNFRETMHLTLCHAVAFVVICTTCLLVLQM